MQKGKLCFFVPFYPLVKGGAEYQSKIIAVELQKRGYEIVYVSSGHKQEQCTLIDGFKVYQLNVTSSLGAKITLYRAFMAKVLNIISEERPDIIYQRILNTFTHRLAGFSKKNDIPFILHIADNYSVEFDKGRKGMLKRKVFESILKKKPFIICQTAYQSEKILKFGYRTAAIIPNMHPVGKNRIADKNRNSIVWIGNARPVKQLEIYLKLAAFYDQSRYKFHVIGKLPESSYGAQLSVAIQNTPNIVYHGSQKNEYVNTFLENTGILVNTSVSEGFSNTFIQAWMRGTPVLALNSDPDHVMTKNKIGVNCEGNYEKMKIVLEQLLVDPDGYQVLCENAFRTARSLFSTEQNMTKFVAILQPLLTKQSTTGN